MIAGIEKNQNSHQSDTEEKKQQKRIRINLEDEDENESEVIKTNQLNRRRNQEIDIYNDYSLYQDQMFQFQWNQMMQLNNMRNVQFNMIMQQQQQQQMMGIFGNVNVSKSQSKKNKKKIHK